MYENQTFDSIMQRMLSNVSDDMDKREGSVIYDAIAPCALELESLYREFKIPDETQNSQIEQQEPENIAEVTIESNE